MTRKLLHFALVSLLLLLSFWLIYFHEITQHLPQLPAPFLSLVNDSLVLSDLTSILSSQ